MKETKNKRLSELFSIFKCGLLGERPRPLEAVTLLRVFHHNERQKEDLLLLWQEGHC